MTGLPLVSAVAVSISLEMSTLAEGAAEGGF
jgi:uncharacterized membrane protein